MLAWNREADYLQQMIKDQFDTLYREGAENGRVMCLALQSPQYRPGERGPSISTRHCATSSGMTASGPRLPTTSPSTISPIDLRLVTTACDVGPIWRGKGGA